MPEEGKQPPQPEARSKGTDLSVRDTALAKEGGIRGDTDVLLGLTRERLRDQPSLAAGIIVDNYMSELNPRPQNTEVLYGQITRHLSVSDALEFDSGIRVVIVRADETMEVEGKEVTMREYLTNHTVFPVLPNNILGGVALHNGKVAKVIPSGRLKDSTIRMPMLDQDFPGDESLARARYVITDVLDAYQHFPASGAR